MLDMNEGYHQLEMAGESRHLTLFHGTSGRMWYRRLNFGMISAQDVFDKAMDDTISGLAGVLHIRDDFIIHGATNEEHNANRTALLGRFKECGLKFNKKKCKFCLPSVEFVFSGNGINHKAITEQDE